MPSYLEIPAGDDDFIAVEVSAQGPVRAGAGNMIGRATDRFDEAMEQVVRLGENAIRQARAVVVPPDAIEIELGLNLTAKAGFVIAESGGEATFKITLKWASPAVLPSPSGIPKGSESPGA